MTELSATHDGDVLTGDEQLAPGVFGYCVNTLQGLYVPVVIAAHEGSGAVGAFLDCLPTTRRVCFPNVMNPRLRGMLARRGFKPVYEHVEEFEVYVREGKEQ